MYQTVTRDVNVELNTDGSSLWSREPATRVGIQRLQLIKWRHEDDDPVEEQWGELRVYFNTSDWDTRIAGLIYTDRGFQAELRTFLEQEGIDPSTVHYSEQGMQGDDYVSLDVGPSFLETFGGAVEAEETA